MISFIKNIFQDKIKAKTALDIKKEDFADVKERNRKTLELVTDWISEPAFKKSFFNYGVPDFIKSDINKQIGDQLTYTDIIMYLSEKHFSEINYFEIGVSVGKNFFQVINASRQGKITGFDIEEINPVLENKLNFLSREEWKTMNGSIKTNPSSLKKYSYQNREVAYLSGDVWDEESWKKLEGSRFNLVFSDALHSPKALLFEFEMLVKYNLLADKFIMFWDDLEGKMQNSFFKIIRKYDRHYALKDVYLLKVNGWVGQNERPHTVGIVSNFEL
jgi:hypothetical protein